MRLLCLRLLPLYSSFASYLFIISSYFCIVVLLVLPIYNNSAKLIIYCLFLFLNFVSAQSLNCVRLFATPWTAACQAFRAVTNSWSLLKLMSIELLMTSNHLILCRPPLLLLSIFPSIRVFSNDSVLHIRWPKYWRFSCSIIPSNEYSGLIFFMINWLDLLAIQGTLKCLCLGYYFVWIIIFPCAS